MPAVADIGPKTETPGHPLRQPWVEEVAAYAVTKHGLADALRKATTPGNDLSSTSTYDAIVGALDRLLRANIAAGIVREGLDADEVILALAGLWQLDREGDWRAQARRLYEIVLSGLQAAGPTATAQGRRAAEPSR